MPLLDAIAKACAQMVIELTAACLNTAHYFWQVSYIVDFKDKGTFCQWNRNKNKNVYIETAVYSVGLFPVLVFLLVVSFF